MWGGNSCPQPLILIVWGRASSPVQAEGNSAVTRSLVTPAFLFLPRASARGRKFRPHPRSLHKTRQAASLRQRNDGFPRPSLPRTQEKGTCTNFSPRSPFLRFSALHSLPRRRITKTLRPHSPSTTRIS